MLIVSFGSFDFTAQTRLGFRGYTNQLNQFTGRQLAVGDASGFFDALGSQQPPKRGDTLMTQWRLIADSRQTVDADLAALRQGLLTGRQWLRILDDDGVTYRRALCKCISVTEARTLDTEWSMTPVQITFQFSEPYWYADLQTTTTYTVNATPFATPLNNLGTAPLVKGILRFTGSANTPTFYNNTNGFTIAHQGSIGPGAVWEINLAAQTVTLNGANDYAALVTPANQIGLFRFEVGNNTVRFQANATPSGQVDFIYRLMYH